jgi:hypothetical protein
MTFRLLTNSYLKLNQTGAERFGLLSLDSTKLQKRLLGKGPLFEKFINKPQSMGWRVLTSSIQVYRQKNWKLKLERPAAIRR